MSRTREHQVALPSDLTDSERMLLERIHECPYDIEIDRGAGQASLTILLGAVDVEGFRSFVADVGSRFDDLPENHIGERIVDEIDQIGSYGVRDGKRVFAGFNDERKVSNRKKKEQRRGPYFYARDNTFSEVNNDLPAEFGDSIVCGDSADVLKSLPDNCVDIVITSPPYNFGLDYDANEDGIEWEKYLDKLFAVLSECVRVLKYGGRILINVQPLFSDYIPLHHVVSNYLMEQQLIWKGEILWEKNNYNCKYTAWGSWKSPSSPYLKYTWEFIEVFAKGTLKKSGDSDKADISGDEFKEWVVARWSIAPERRMEEFGHPAMFPEELVERGLKLFSYRGDVVLDPFNGVGTTTAVAERMGRRYVGVDISEEYCRVARERMAGQLSLM